MAIAGLASTATIPMTSSGARRINAGSRSTREFSVGELGRQRSDVLGMNMAAATDN